MLFTNGHFETTRVFVMVDLAIVSEVSPLTRLTTMLNVSLSARMQFQLHSSINLEDTKLTSDSNGT